MYTEDLRLTGCHGFRKIGQIELGATPRGVVIHATTFTHASAPDIWHLFQPPRHLASAAGRPLSLWIWKVKATENKTHQTHQAYQTHQVIPQSSHLPHMLNKNWIQARGLNALDGSQIQSAWQRPLEGAQRKTLNDNSTGFRQVGHVKHFPPPGCG